MPKVTVLLSTYNGEKFLKQQIESILAQTGVSVKLCVRDDGSRDGTSKILKRYALQQAIKFTSGDNIGWKRSFFQLLLSAHPEEGSFYAFADQDDVWQPDKLVTAVKMLGNSTTPSVYHSNVAIMDGQMNFVGNRFSADFSPDTTFPTNFFDGFGVGATMVFNNPMLLLAQRLHPEKATNHDAFVMALGNLLGRVVYDSTPHIWYRRHEGAATGFGGSGSVNAANPSLLARYRRYLKGPKHQFSIRAGEIVRTYKSLLDKRQLRVLVKVSDYRSHFIHKLSLLFDPHIKATGVRRTLQIKYRVLNNTL